MIELVIERPRRKRSRQKTNGAEQRPTARHARPANERTNERTKERMGGRLSLKFNSICPEKFLLWMVCHAGRSSKSIQIFYIEFGSEFASVICFWGASAEVSVRNYAVFLLVVLLGVFREYPMPKAK